MAPAHYAGAMASARDDALSWAGDDDPTLDTGPSRGDEPERARLAPGYTAVGRGADGVDGGAAKGSEPAKKADEKSAKKPDEPAPDTDDGERPQMGGAALISLGVLGGIAVLYAIGWIIGGLRLLGQPAIAVDAMATASLWLAAAAPLIWFGTVLYATRDSAAWLRWIGLAAGVVLLVPWPFLSIGPTL